MNYLFLHCRGGFEKECAAEITDLATAAGIYGYSKTTEGSAHVSFVTHEPEGALKLIKALDFRALIFTRQWFAGPAPLEELPTTDRLTPLLAAVADLPEAAEVMAETVDTNDGKALSDLGKKFSRPFMAALKREKHIKATSPWRLHLVFLSGTSAAVGVSPLANSSALPAGIARLRLPRAAPSRATLKLEEAWHHFIPKEEWETRLGPGLKAVDLGAAPGGWTWQLVQRGMFVQAVDNGPMDVGLMDSGQVVHHREDGFIFVPKKPVYWLVCDIADKPARVVHLISRWAERGDFTEAVFNLKLPMKQRYRELVKLRERLEDQLATTGRPASVAFRQLYHDREEVTAHIRFLDERRG